MVPESVRTYIRSISMKRMIEWLYSPDGSLGQDPILERDLILLEALAGTMKELTTRFGADLGDWEYGQIGYKHALIKHPLSDAVDTETRSFLDVGPAPRGGNSYTVNNTSGQDNQISGGSFRIIVDTGDWDNTLATNAPGQHGDPAHPHYRNLFGLWARDQYFPLYYSRSKVERVRDYTTLLLPSK